MGSTAQRERDLELANIAKKHGAQFSLRIVQEARLAKLSVSLGFALVEQESGFRNVFGHDAGQPFAGAGRVTKEKYLQYKAVRGHDGSGGMQGVGPTQLTYYTFQDRADALGGCWQTQYNIRVAFQDLAKMIAQHGPSKGLGVYNAGEAGWERGNGHDYSRQVRDKAEKWHRLLMEG